MLTADDKKKLLIAYLDSYISRISNYHNHKETMVNVALLLQLGLFGAIVNKDWSSIQISNIVIIAIFLFFWSIVHIYMKWQLSNKIRSSLYYNGIDQSMRQLILDDNLLIETIKNEDISLNQTVHFQEDSKLISSTYSKVVFYFNLIFKSSPTIKYDSSTSDLPNFVEENINKAILNGTYASFHEKLVNRGSFLILILSISRIVFF